MSLRCVLLVDDDADSAFLIHRVLKQCGFDGEYLVETEGQKGVGIYKQRTQERKRLVPQLAFVDLNLPDKHGFELIRELKAADCARRLFIVALSHSLEQDDIHCAFSVGANAYVEKYPEVDEMKVLLAAMDSSPSSGLCLMRPIRKDPPSEPLGGGESRSE